MSTVGDRGPADNHPRRHGCCPQSLPLSAARESAPETAMESHASRQLPESSPVHRSRNSTPVQARRYRHIRFLLRYSRWSHSASHRKIHHTGTATDRHPISGCPATAMSSLLPYPYASVSLRPHKYCVYCDCESSVSECNPHSILAKPLHRPARSSSPGSTARVQGWQPMLV